VAKGNLTGREGACLRPRGGARSLLAGLQNAQAEQSRLEAEKRAVLDVLQMYSESYNNKDANALRQVYPSVPVNIVREAFRYARSYELNLKLTPEDPKILNDTASVRCQRVVKLTDSFGLRSLRTTRSLSSCERMAAVADRQG
jgi:hypothetical protein